jgi:hypothetical protein
VPRSLAADSNDIAGHFAGHDSHGAGLEAGSEQYAPLARAIIGGLTLSVVVTVFLVPAVYLLIHGRSELKAADAEGTDHE